MSDLLIDGSFIKYGDSPWLEMHEGEKLLAAALADAQAEIEGLKGQLHAVDMVLARRSALDDIADRADKILHAINTAKRAEKAEAERDLAIKEVGRIARELGHTQAATQNTGITILDAGREPVVQKPNMEVD